MYTSFAQLWAYWTTIGVPTFLAVLLPALVALACGVWARRYFTDRRVLIAIGGMTLVNILFMVPQTILQLDSGTHLLPAYIICIIFMYRQLGIRTSVPAAFAATWLTIFIPDVLSVVGHHFALHTEAAHIWTAFAWVGGAGAADGLIWFPLITALVSAIVPWGVDALRNYRAHAPA
jgi:hypothetical protein